MKIKKLVLGQYMTNSYIVTNNENAAHCIIIDTGLDDRPLISYLENNSLNPLAVILTHGHADHITAVPSLKKIYPELKVAIHKLDAQMLTDHTKNLSQFAGISFATEPADIELNDDQTIDFADIALKVIHTPGHTPGGICLYNQPENILFVGDTLFEGSVGRTDFPYGDTDQLISSIKNKLFELPPQTVCLPGHGPQTTIDRERKYNPFLQF